MGGVPTNHNPPSFLHHSALHTTLFIHTSDGTNTNDSDPHQALLNKLHRMQVPHILLDGIKLEQVSHFKYLRVWISADLTWSKHIMLVTCKVCWLLGYIFRTFSPSAITTLYRAQALPILDYSCIIWDPHRQPLLI